MAQIILIRGLATVGGDNLGFGPIHFGAMMKHTARTLNNLGFKPFVLNGMGNGPLVEHVEKAVQMLSREQFVTAGEPLHLVGHSMGGLIARSLALEPRLNVVAITTLATPHEGAGLARVALEMASHRPLMHAVWETAGYRFETRRQVFQDLTPESVRDWNLNHPDPEGVDIASFQFSVPRAQLSPPLRALYRHFPPTFQPTEFDGYVELKSQHRGHSLGHFALDHLAANGWNFHVWPPLRRQFQNEYNRFTEALKARLQDIENRYPASTPN